MKKKNKLHRIITALVVALAIVLVLPTASVDAAGAKMNKKSVTVCTGKSYTLKMSGISKKVKWSTSDKSVVSLSKKSGKKAEKCTVKGKKNGTATITAKVKVGKKTKTFRCKVTVKGHSYKKATYSWHTDIKKCTASKECSRCHKTLKQTVKTTKRTIKKATCTAKGNAKYTAKFTKYNFGTKTKKVTTEKLDHACKEPTYTWSDDFSMDYATATRTRCGMSCTATATCKRCGEGFSEKVKAAGVVTTEATKDSTGVMTYTAKFKNKTFQTQIKTETIPKIAYVDKSSIMVRSDRPEKISVVNATISSARCDNIWDFDVVISKDKTYATVTTTDKIGDAKGIITIVTNTGEKFNCTVGAEFTPGTKYVGVGALQVYSRNEAPYYYCAYGDLKGTWQNHGAYDYIVTCQTREEYDAAEYYFTHQTLSDGRIGDLADKVNDIDSQCYVRRDYSIDYMNAIQAKAKEKGFEAWEVHEYFTAYPNSYEEAYYTFWENGFAYGYTNTEIDNVVKNWATYCNKGVMPSWYYATAYKDWCEWSGHDYVE